MKKLKPCAGRILFGKRMFLRKPGKRKVIQCFNQPAFGSGPGDIELPDKNFSLKTILNPRMSAIKTRQTCNNFFRLLDRHMVQRHRRRSSHADKAGDSGRAKSDKGQSLCFPPFSTTFPEAAFLKNPSNSSFIFAYISRILCMSMKPNDLI